MKVLTQQINRKIQQTPHLAKRPIWGVGLKGVVGVVVFSVIIIAILMSLYFDMKSTALVETDENNLKELNQFSSNYANWERALLKLNAGISKTDAELNKSTVNMKMIIQQISHFSLKGINQNELQDLFKSKLDLIENFKAKHADLKTTLNNANHIHEQLLSNQNVNSDLLLQVKNILGLINAYDDTDSDTIYQIQQEISNLELAANTLVSEAHTQLTHLQTRLEQQQTAIQVQRNVENMKSHPRTRPVDQSETFPTSQTLVNWINESMIKEKAAQAQKELVTLKKQIENAQIQLPIHQEILAKTQQFIKDVVQIVELQPRIKAILIEIDKIDLTRVVGNIFDEIESTLQNHITAQKNNTLKLSVYLVFFAALLILLGIYLFKNARMLRKSNDMLAALVDDKTAAMQALQASEVQLIQSEKMASLGQLVAGLAHEINTPLAYAKSSMETLQSYVTETAFPRFVAHAEQILPLLTDENIGKLPESAQSHLLQAKIALREMNGENAALVTEMGQLADSTLYGLNEISKLIINLRNFSRLDKGQVAEHLIQDSIDSAIMLLKHDLKDKKITTDYRCDLKLLCMPSQINQVFLNLLSNANQAISPNGHIDISVTAAPDTDNEPPTIIVKVKDDGHGIPADKLSQIFDPFFTTKEVGKGTGLGLSICYKIIEEHGGKIEVESSVSTGTTFTLILPAVPNQSNDSDML